MAGFSAAKARRKANAADERLFDRELEDLPAELRWREWMLRVEAVIFASSEPVTRETLGRLVDQLRTLWGTRGKWESYNALVDVGAVGFRLFEEFGVHARPQPDGQAYINVPFTADTIPAGSAQVDLLRALMGGYRS